jgi:hypothetical protein
MLRCARVATGLHTVTAMAIFERRRRTPIRPPAVPERPGVTFQPTKLRPWHSIRETDRKVWHDDARCSEARGIEEQFRREGTEGRRKCEECQQL